MVNDGKYHARGGFLEDRNERSLESLVFGVYGTGLYFYVNSHRNSPFAWGLYQRDYRKARYTIDFNSTALLLRHYAVVIHG